MKYKIDNLLDKKLLSDEDAIVEADNSADAVRDFLKKKDIEYDEIRRSGDRDVRICAIPFRVREDGEMVKDGNVVWYKVKKGNKVLL